MRQRYRIEVRRYPEGKTHHTSNTYDVVDPMIERVVWAEQIGNFSPLFCRYKGKRTQIHSDEGDLSDPFRRDEDLYQEPLHRDGGGSRWHINEDPGVILGASEVGMCLPRRNASEGFNRQKPR